MSAATTAPKGASGRCPMAIQCIKGLPLCVACKRKTPALTAEQKRRVRELVEDEGHTRAEAIAWVLAFEVTR